MVVFFTLQLNLLLSAPSVAIFLRLRLRFSDTGGNRSEVLDPKSALLPQESLTIFLATKSRKRLRFLLRFLGKKSVLTAVWLARGRLRQKIAVICDCDFRCSQIC